jgi:predicted MFS family arabinose efflux permease
MSCLIGIVLFAGSWLFVPRGPKAASRTFRQVWQSYLELAFNRRTGSALYVSFCISGGTLAFLTYISGYLNEAFGLDALAISSVFLIAGLAAVLASPVSGWLSDRWSKRRVFLFSNTLLGIPLLLLVRLEWSIFLFGALFLISLFISFRQTSLQTLQTQLVSFERRGSFLALRNCFSQLGISLSVFLAGMLYSDFGYLAVTFLAAGLTLVASVLLYFLIPEPKGR